MIDVRVHVDVNVCLFVFESHVGVYCAHNCVCFSFNKQTNQQQGGEVMDESVKKWWPKVAAAAGADTEQSILDLAGV